MSRDHEVFCFILYERMPYAGSICIYVYVQYLCFACFVFLLKHIVFQTYMLYICSIIFNQRKSVLFSLFYRTCTIFKLCGNLQTYNTRYVVVIS